jgi:DNA-binding transcriptional LysR family regulator
MASNGWPGLELRYLAALEAVADERSFGRAADQLGYTQSAVSQQIAALERIVGARLIERPPGHRTVTLTDAGELLLRHAREIGARVRAAEADLSALRDGNGGLLRVGAFQSVGARILPSLLQRFRNAWPGVEVLLDEAVCDRELQHLVAVGDLDLTFATFPTLEGPFESVELLRDPYVLMVRTGSPLAERHRPPAEAELAALPLVTFQSSAGAQSEEDHLRARGIAPSIVLRSNDNGTIRGLVAEGVCAGLVPQLAADPADPEIRTVPLQDLIPPRVVGLVWHRDRELPESATSFIAAAQSVSRSLEPVG